MKKLLFVALLAFTSIAHAAWPTNTCVVDSVSGNRLCGWYNIVTTTAAGQEVSIPYSAIAPAGYTGQIRITRGFIRDWRIYPASVDTGSVLLIESPAGSSKWHTPLAWADKANPTKNEAWVDNEILSPGDELCLQTYGAVGQISYSIEYTVSP